MPNLFILLTNGNVLNLEQENEPRKGSDTQGKVFFIVLRRDLCVYHDDSLTSYRVIMPTEQPTECFVPLRKLRVRLGP